MCLYSYREEPKKRSFQCGVVSTSSKFAGTGAGAGAGTVAGAGLANGMLVDVKW